MRRAFDLSGLAEKLRGKPRYRAVADAIGRLQSAWSIHLDLVGAGQAIEILREIHTDDTARTRFAAALTAHAILLYCRGVVSDQQGRYRVNATRDFSAEQMVTHKAIADLRNTVIAHYDKPKGSFAEDWNKERLVLKVLDDGTQGVTFAVSRANFMKVAIEGLEEVTHVATVTVQTIVDERQTIMRDAIEAHTELFEVLFGLPFSPAEFHVSQDLVEDFWRGDGQHIGPVEAYGPNLRRRH